MCYGSRGFVRLLMCAALIALLGRPAVAQSEAEQSLEEKTSPDKHLLGVIPNFGTARANQPFTPLTPKEKFTIAYHDSLDWSSFVIGAGYGGLAQMEGQNPSFGDGVGGYAKRAAGAYGDQAIGNLFTEGVLPTLLHEDPRYFPRVTGSRWARARYALSRSVVTRTDSGRWRFNTSQIAGESIAVAISNAYYPDTRNVSDNLQRLGIQLATNAFMNTLREFWPDIKYGVFRRPRPDPDGR